MRMSRAVLPAIACVLVGGVPLLPGRLAAQRLSSVVRVLVTDTTGAPLSGAEVTIVTGLKTVLARGTTDGAGRQVLVASMDTADYGLVVRRIGFQRADRFFHVGPRDTLSFVIPIVRVAQALAPVEVTAPEYTP